MVGGFRRLIARAALVGLTVTYAAAAQTVAPAPASPSAAGPSEPALAEARERYRAGAAAYAEGRFKDAIDLFLEADKRRPSAALSFNIARAYEKLRDAAGALRWYRDYLRRAENPEDATQVQNLVATFADKLREKGVQQVTVLSEPLGATVFVDRTPVGVTPWTGELTPGTHHVELRLRGYSDAERDFELAPTTPLDVELTLSTAPAAKDTTPTPTRRPAAEDTQRGPTIPLRTWGYISLGVAGAAFAGALTFDLLRRSAEKDAKNEPVQIDHVEEVDRANSRRTTSRVFAGAGAGFAALGGALIAVDLLRGKPASARKPKPWQLACASTGCSATYTREF